MFTLAFGIKPLGPKTLAILESEDIMSGVAKALSKFTGTSPLAIDSIKDVPPATVAPASVAALTVSSLDANTTMLIFLPVPFGSDVDPRSD